MGRRVFQFRVGRLPAACGVLLFAIAVGLVLLRYFKRHEEKLLSKAELKMAKREQRLRHRTRSTRTIGTSERMH